MKCVSWWAGGNTPGCITAAVNIKRDAACIPAAGVGGGGGRPALHDTSRISSGTHSSSGNNTMHAVWSSTGRKPNKAFMFSHFLRIV